jgi:hypothetical protein
LPHVNPPSIDLSAMTTLFFRLFSFGPFVNVTYTVPSGPMLGRASWSNWFPWSLTAIGPVQWAPSSSLNAIWMGERPEPLNSAQATNSRPKWCPAPVPVSTAMLSWSGRCPLLPFWVPFDLPVVTATSGVHAGNPPTSCP